MKMNHFLLLKRLVSSTLSTSEVTNLSVGVSSVGAEVIRKPEARSKRDSDKNIALLMNDNEELGQ